MDNDDTNPDISREEDEQMEDLDADLDRTDDEYYDNM